MALLVSSTEPPLLRNMPGARVSTKPELYGADVMWVANRRLYGVQRKTWADLVASMADDRLVREVAQARVLDVRILVLEGRPTVTADGAYMIGRRAWSAEQMLGLRLSLQQAGWWIERTDNVVGTVKTLGAIEAWSRKARHDALESRAVQAKSAWGLGPTDRAFAVHLLQSIPGVGVELARRIYDELGMPFGWKVTVDDLMKVKGVGKGKAARMYAAIGGMTDGS